MTRGKGLLPQVPCPACGRPVSVYEGNVVHWHLGRPSHDTLGRQLWCPASGKPLP